MNIYNYNIHNNILFLFYLNFPYFNDTTLFYEII